MANHRDVVERIKAQLEARGVNLTGPCGAFEITKRVAWELRGEGAGLLDKPGGNNCRGYAVDIVAYPAGAIVDILSDAGNGNGPSWGEGFVDDPGRWRPAVDPGDAGQPPAPPVQPPVPIPPTDPGVLEVIKQFYVFEEMRHAEILQHFDRVHRESAAILTALAGGYTGSVRLPYFGTVTINLIPVRK